MARLLLCGLYAKRFFSGESAAVYEFTEVCSGDYVKISGKFLLRADGRLFFLGEAPAHASSFLVEDIGLPFYAQPQEVISPSDGAVWTSTFQGDSDGFIAIDSFGRLWVLMGGSFTVGGGYSYSPTLVDDTKTWVACSAARSTALAVTSTGELWSGGYNNHGQCGRGSITENQPWGQVSGSNWADVKITALTTLAVTTTGVVHACGYNYYGQCGRGTTQIRYVSLGPVVGLPASGSTVLIPSLYTCLVGRGGVLYTAGMSTYFRPPFSNTPTFKLVNTVPFEGVTPSDIEIGHSEPNTVRVSAGGTLFVLGPTYGALIGLPEDSPLPSDEWYEHELRGDVLSIEANFNETWVLVEGEGGPPPAPTGFWTSFNLTYEIP